MTQFALDIHAPFFRAKSSKKSSRKPQFLQVFFAAVDVPISQIARLLCIFFTQHTAIWGEFSRAREASRNGGIKVTSLIKRKKMEEMHLTQVCKMETFNSLLRQASSAQLSLEDILLNYLCHKAKITDSLRGSLQRHKWLDRALK